jgi:hypothetical protein
LIGRPARSQAVENPAETAAASAAFVDEPLLAPAPRASTEIVSWQQARTLLETQATDLQSAVAAVARAGTCQQL